MSHICIAAPLTLHAHTQESKSASVTQRVAPVSHSDSLQVSFLTLASRCMSINVEENFTSHTHSNHQSAGVAD